MILVLMHEEITTFNHNILNIFQEINFIYLNELITKNYIFKMQENATNFGVVAIYKFLCKVLARSQSRHF